jgi:carbon monoxide dehydrogenase subunit G
MKLQGEYRLEYPRERVWAALMDPEVLARTLPGCERLERVDASTFRGVLNVAIGPVKGAFSGTLALTELVPPAAYRMRLDGSGSAGFMKGEGAVQLADDGAGTLLRYDLDAQVGGRVAGVGQRLVESSARSIARQGLEGLERQLAAGAGAPAVAAAAREGAAEPAPPSLDAPLAGTPPAAAPHPEPPPRAAPPPPAASALAWQVATDVAGDVVPPGTRLAVALSIAALLLSIAALVVALR